MTTRSVDDRDASIIYSTGWGQAGTPSEFLGTTTFTSTAGSQASIDFRGTRISVVGTINPIRGVTSTPPVTAYSIDGAAPFIFRAQPENAVQFNTTFFQSPVLPNAQHTLLITNTVAGENTILDVFLIEAPAPTTIGAGDRQPGVTSRSTSSIRPTETGQVNPVGAASSSEPLNVGAIAGGVAGGLLVLLLVLVLLIVFRRRQKRIELEAIETPDSFWNRATPISGDRYAMLSAPSGPSRLGLLRPTSPTNSSVAGSGSNSGSSMTAYAQQDRAIDPASSVYAAQTTYAPSVASGALESRASPRSHSRSGSRSRQQQQPPLPGVGYSQMAQLAYVDQIGGGAVTGPSRVQVTPRTQATAPRSQTLTPARPNVLANTNTALFPPDNEPPAYASAPDEPAPINLPKANPKLFRDRSNR